MHLFIHYMFRDCGLSMCQFIKENKDELKNYDTLLELGNHKKRKA